MRSCIFLVFHLLHSFTVIKSCWGSNKNEGSEFKSQWNWSLFKTQIVIFWLSNLNIKLLIFQPLSNYTSNWFVVCHCQTTFCFFLLLKICFWDSATTSGLFIHTVCILLRHWKKPPYFYFPNVCQIQKKKAANCGNNCSKNGRKKGNWYSDILNYNLEVKRIVVVACLLESC